MTAAAADVSVFGHIDTSVDYNDISDTNFDGEGPFSVDDTNLHCTTCSIGFKGSEDLGNGLKAIFSIDFQYNTTERGGRSTSGNQDDTLRHWYGSDASAFGAEGATDAITDRDQWLGLSGGFGQVRVGTISTVYKSHGAMIDPLYRTSLQAREHGLQSNEFHSGAGEETQGRATNTFRYDSPNFSGFKVAGTYTVDNNKDDPAGSEDDNPWGIGGSYENGGILVFADYITNEGSSTNPFGDISAWKLGGKYTFGDFAVMGQYEDGQDDAVNTEFTQWHLGGSFTMGSNMLYAAYGQREDDDTGVTILDGTAYTIAGVHNFSKNTSAYLGYNKIDADYDVIQNLEKDQISLGMKHKF
jgi:predicted porin